MASAAVIAFHNANMADEKRRVALRIANGTKGSSPQIISYRHSHPSFKGLPHNSTGSRNAPFFVNTNQRGHPFDGIVGGVIKDYRFARELLDQRARSTNELAALKEGIPVPPATPSAMLTLSPEDSRVLELNQLLQTIQDIVEANALESLGTTISSDLKSILRLFVALLPSFSESDLGDFTQYFEELIIQLDAAADNAPTPQSRAAVGQTRTFFTNLLALIRGFMATPRRTDTGEVITESNMTKTDREKASLIRALVRQIFKTDIGRLREARAERGRVAQVAAEEEGGDDDGLDGDEALAVGAQGGPQRVVAAALGAPGGGMAAAVPEEGQAAAAVDPRGPIVAARAFLAENGPALKAAMRRDPEFAFLAYSRLMSQGTLQRGLPGGEYVPTLGARFLRYPVESAIALRRFLGTPQAQAAGLAVIA
jgi:hypothetical protein